LFGDLNSITDDAWTGRVNINWRRNTHLIQRVGFDRYLGCGIEHGRDRLDAESPKILADGAGK
jgi:hypothetical protein